MIKVGFSGLTGMIGKNAIIYLDKNPALKKEFTLIAFTRKDSNTDFLKEHGIEYRIIDYTEPRSFDGKLADLDAFMHFAGLTKSIINKRFYEVNLEETVVLFEAIRRYGKNIRHIMYSSSIQAAGPSPGPFDLKKEGDPDSPISHYGKSKLKAEEYIRSTDQNWTILRFPAVFGPYDADILHIFKLAKSGVFVTLGKGDDYGSYILAQDLAKLLFKIILNDKTFRNTYYVCYDLPVRVLDYCSEVRRELGLKPNFLYIRLPRFLVYLGGICIYLRQRLMNKITYVNLEKLKELMGKYWSCSNEKLKHALGIPSIVEQGAFSQTIKWFRERNLL